LAPLQPPDAVQEVAFDELHVRFEAAPLLTLLCEALINAVGDGWDEPPLPQDTTSSDHAAAVAEPRLENCMPFRQILRICVTVSVARCNSMRATRYDYRMGRKLHIGGRLRTDGWEVLDANPGAHVDHVADARDGRRCGDDTVEEIYASHVVEHLDYKDELVTTLSGWRRVMVPGGTLSVSVPDLDVLARLFLDPALSLHERFTVMRMMFGGHVDRFDYHLVGLNEQFITGFLRAAGFVDARRVAAFDQFDDASRLEMRGTPISVNIVARKAARPDDSQPSRP